MEFCSGEALNDAHGFSATGAVPRSAIGQWRKRQRLASLSTALDRVNCGDHLFSADGWSALTNSIVPLSKSILPVTRKDRSRILPRDRHSGSVASSDDYRCRVLVCALLLKESI